jgi:hypothetical protein
MKKKLLIIYTLSYLAIVAAFTAYWASHFMAHIHEKGEDFEVCVDFLVPLTYLLFVLISLTVKKIHLIALLLAPAILVMASILLGLLVLWVLRLDGTPGQIIYVFCSVYGLLAVLIILQVLAPLLGQLKNKRQAGQEC